MKLPKLEDIEFSPLLWKESIIKGSELHTVRDVYSLLTKDAENLESLIKAINVDVSNSRIRRLINGYILFDILAWKHSICFSRYKMWAFFEDLVAEARAEIEEGEGMVAESVEESVAEEATDIAVEKASE